MARKWYVFNENHTWNFEFGFSSFLGLVLCSPALSCDAGQGSHSPPSATWSQRWMTDTLTAILDQETALLFPFKRLLLIKENRTSQVMELSACLCVGRCGVWAHRSQSWDLHLSSRGHCRCFPILSPFRAHCQGSCGWVAATCFVPWHGSEIVHWQVW